MTRALDEDRHMPQRIDFKVNGIRFTLSREDVVAALDGVPPEPIRSHAVTIAGTHYPVKQAFAQATSLDRLDFTSAVARRNLGRLGFGLHRADG